MQGSIAPAGPCLPVAPQGATATGAKAIQRVRVGDRVWARDLTTGRSQLRQVTGLFTKRADRLVHISVAGAVIQVTPEHPFYSPDKGWSTPGQLRMGDRLLARTHGISLARSSTRSGFHGRG